MDSFKTVPNAADYNPVVLLEAANYDVSNTVRSFWKTCPIDNVVYWYKIGETHGDITSLKTGNDMLRLLLTMYTDIIKKYMRDNNVPLSANLVELMNVLHVIGNTIISDSIHTISINNCKLQLEQVLAYVQGEINSQYNKVRNIHEK